MVPQIWSATDRIFCHLGPFFALLPPNNPKIQNFEKMEKLPGDTIILHRHNTNNNHTILQMCTISDNHMMYGSRDMEHMTDRIFVILDNFLPLYPLNKLKNQNFEINQKTTGHITILNMCTINDNDMMYSS